MLAPGLVAALGLALLDPIPQDPRYHRFADRRICLAIRHCGDVLTNAGFLVVGAVGVCFLRRGTRRTQLPADRCELLAWRVFFLGVLFTGIGSAWYHLQPDNTRLVWDRLPMTLGFMSLMTIAVSERIDTRLAGFLLGPLLALGLASVAWWAYTEQQGQGDLRPYAFVQFYPGVALMLMLLLLPSRYTHGNDYWWMLLGYGAAKLAELLDGPLYEGLGLVSGHGLKHLLAAAAAASVLPMLARRRPVGVPALAAKAAPGNRT